MTQTENQHWQDLVASYVPAARELGIPRGELDMALRIATRFEGQCPSCCFSRAPLNALTQAERFGVLTIYERHCTMSPPRRKCPTWQKLAPPIEVITEKETPSNELPRCSCGQGSATMPGPAHHHDCPMGKEPYL